MVFYVVFLYVCVCFCVYMCCLCVCGLCIYVICVCMFCKCVVFCECDVTLCCVSMTSFVLNRWCDLLFGCAFVLCIYK